MTELGTKPKTKSDKKRLLMTNVLLWGIAAVLHPLAHLLPTSTGQPPRIVPLFIFLMFLALGWLSTYILNGAIGKTVDQ
ncbi:MAG: hypothetical protein H6822_28055 [Planctomycetaceae bacterium]|nr:hypothetical protein [Planctomycetales bacterium]MCB9926035.1 hypothetical protein [Planctomycetaceae bacterium]